MKNEWSVCLLDEAELPLHVLPGEVSLDKRLNLDDPKVIDAIEKCENRLKHPKYINGACNDSCPCKQKLNLRAVEN